MRRFLPIFINIIYRACLIYRVVPSSDELQPARHSEKLLMLLRCLCHGIYKPIFFCSLIKCIRNIFQIRTVRRHLISFCAAEIGDDISARRYQHTLLTSVTFTDTGRKFPLSCFRRFARRYPQLFYIPLSPVRLKLHSDFPLDRLLFPLHYRRLCMYDSAVRLVLEHGIAVKRLPVYHFVCRHHSLRRLNLVHHLMRKMPFLPGFYIDRVPL